MLNLADSFLFDYSLSHVQYKYNILFYFIYTIVIQIART